MYSPKGSSPLTRGSVETVPEVMQRARFIPAYAGFWAAAICRALFRAVHPRLRGVLVIMRPRRKSQKGSSPLTRGSGLKLDMAKELARFIPAYAGFWYLRWLFAVCLQVHPRLRGVLILSMMHLSPKLGSSPLTRGSATIDVFEGDFGRFIPAYAGFCGPLYLDRSPLRVHPRLRGVLQHLRVAMVRQIGSSPLTRGSGRGGLAGRSWRGFIPAYAGFCSARWPPSTT